MTSVGGETQGEERKRKVEGEADGANQTKLFKLEDGMMKPKAARVVASGSREIRLEQNRKAARESRRRKKVMIEELQRSVIFFSRANGTLKQQNDELTRFLMQAQMQIAAIESHKDGATSVAAAAAAAVAATAATDATNEAKAEAGDLQKEQAEADAVAKQAVYETKGFPAVAARAAAQTMAGSAKVEEADPAPKPPSHAAAAAAAAATQPPLPPMQPGATMQAMANFQQAAAAAMQSAMGQMQNVPGVSVTQLSAAAPPAGTNAQQAYTDTMTALAMQQAAAAAAAGMMQPGMHLLLPQWHQQQQLAASKEAAEQAQNTGKEE